MQVWHFLRGIFRWKRKGKLKVWFRSTRRDPGFIFCADIVGTNHTSKFTFFLVPPCHTIIIDYELLTAWMLKSRLQQQNRFTTKLPNKLHSTLFLLSLLLVFRTKEFGEWPLSFVRWEQWESLILLCQFCVTHPWREWRWSRKGRRDLREVWDRRAWYQPSSLKEKLVPSTEGQRRNSSSDS